MNNKRWFMLDLARERTFVREEFLMILDKLKDFHYNGLGLYLETAFEFKCFPGVPREGVMTHEDAAWAVEEGKKRGLFLFPMTNVAAHMELYLKGERGRRITGAYLPAYKQVDFSMSECKDFALEIVHELSEAFDTKFVHIGGDEAHLPTEELRLSYGAFVSDICRALLGEGMTPAIWGDMLWEHQEIEPLFPRQTSIFDWHYYGHRPESPRFFVEKGFSSVIPCPCDNSWNFYIAFQHEDPASKPRIAPDAVETFLMDAEEVGIEDGFLTHWENHDGALFFSNMTAFARAGLYLDRVPYDDEAVEMAMFGHITPYSTVVRKIQDDIISYGEYYDHRRHRALFLEKSRATYLSDAPWMYEKYGEHTRAVLPEIEALVNGYQPENDFEALAFRSLSATVAMIRATLETGRAYAENNKYAEAAALQFEKPEEGKTLLCEIIESFRLADEATLSFHERFVSAVKGTGHAPRDEWRIRRTSSFLKACIARLEDAIEHFARIPILRWEYIVATENADAWFLA